MVSIVSRLCSVGIQYTHEEAVAEVMSEDPAQAETCAVLARRLSPTSQEFFAIFAKVLRWRRILGCPP
jgi:hypothetical protein